MVLGLRSPITLLTLSMSPFSSCQTADTRALELDVPASPIPTAGSYSVCLRLAGTRFVRQVPTVCAEGMADRGVEGMSLPILTLSLRSPLSRALHPCFSLLRFVSVWFCVRRTDKAPPVVTVFTPARNADVDAHMKTLQLAFNEPIALNAADGSMALRIYQRFPYASEVHDCDGEDTLVLREVVHSSAVDEDGTRRVTTPTPTTLRVTLSELAVPVAAAEYSVSASSGLVADVSPAANRWVGIANDGTTSWTLRSRSITPRADTLDWIGTCSAEMVRLGR